MKFIHAKFFYKNDDLINESLYSYWWILMGTLNRFGHSIGYDSSKVNESTWNNLKSATISYTIGNNSEVSLKNAYVCGMAQAAAAPSVAEGDDETSKGTVILNVAGAGASSIIPFTVGQNMSDVGHEADSLWLIALPKNIEVDNNISKLFPFELDSSNQGYETQKYVGVKDPNFDLSDNSKCIPLIGYNVSSSDTAVNSINFSGFTVGSSVVTLNGLVE